MTSPMPVPESAHTPQHAVSEASAPVVNPSTPPEGALVDEMPALSGLVPEQTAESVDEGVDAASMPAFRSLRGQLPAARFHVKAQLAALEKMVPEGMKGASEDMVLDKLPEVDRMFQAMQDLVLDRAADREAMTAWLCEQENGEGALLAAFGKLSESLGN